MRSLKTLILRSDNEKIRLPHFIKDEIEFATPNTKRHAQRLPPLLLHPQISSLSTDETSTLEGQNYLIANLKETKLNSAS